MSNKIIINTFHLSPYMFQPLSDGRIPAEILSHTIKLMPFQGEVLELHPSHQELTLGFPRCLISSDDNKGFWDTLQSMDIQEGDVMIIQGDHPLLDIPIIEGMMELHYKYLAEFTFADAWPIGLAPEIIKSSIIPRISKLALNNNLPVDNHSLFSLIQKDINQFDLETLVAPVDFRPFRLDFSLRNKEASLLVDRFISRDKKDSRDMESWVNDYPEDLRTIPAYLQLQLNQQCPQSCSYCPYPQIHPGLLEPGKEMDLSVAERILDEFEEINPEGTISLSLWGEPSLYSHIYSLMDKILNHKGFQLIIETSGIGWDQSKLEPLLVRGRQKWIVSLDSIQPEIYSFLRGRGLAEVESFIQYLENQIRDNLYCQAIRIQENEDALEILYKNFQKRTANLIVQKYDHFCGFLEQRKVTDLSPVKRFPCWHNKRDMVIMVDGRVPICREDIKGQWNLGSVHEESLLDIWQKGQSLYQEHLEGQYNNICRECDEYYTYNF